MTETKFTPTESELEVLQILWKGGPCTVRQVHDYLSNQKKIVYTTILKTMQIMHDKGLVARDESGRSHVYTAAVSESQVQTTILGTVMDKAFGGSAAKVAMHALSNHPSSSDELKELRRLLDKMEKDVATSGTK